MTARPPLPRLLDEGLRETARLHPLTLSVTLNLRPPHRATMVLPPEERVSLRDLVELYTVQGSAGVFRVTAVENIPGEGSEVTLRHASAALGDALIPGMDELVGTPRQVLSALLARQTASPRWALGDVELPESRTLSCAYNNSNLLTALGNILDELPGYALVFEQAGSAWTMHLRRLTDEDACECRLHRNLKSAAVSLDDSGLCTRVYVNGLDAPVDAPSMAQWGPVSRAIAADPKLGEAALTQLARQYLELHAQPALTVRLSALDLHEATGEHFDSFRLGRMCRVSIPSHDAILRERIVSVSYPDALGAPERAEVTLADRDRDTADYVSGLMAHVHMVYRGLARSGKRLLLMAEEIKLKASSKVVTELETRTTLAEITLDGLKGEIVLKASQKVVDELSTRLSKAEIDIDGANAQIALKASRREVDELATRLTKAEIDVDGLAAEITLKASKTVTDDLGKRLNAAEIAIDGANAQIDLKVSKNGVISAINLSGESAVIQAGRIDLKGYVTASQLSAKIADFEQSWASELYSGNIGARYVTAGSGDFDDLVCGGFYASSAKIGGYQTDWKKATVVTSVGKPTLAFNWKTIYYKDHDGVNQSLMVITGYTGNTLPTFTTTTVNYLGR